MYKQTAGKTQNKSFKSTWASMLQPPYSNWIIFIRWWINRSSAPLNTSNCDLLHSTFKKSICSMWWFWQYWSSVSNRTVSMCCWGYPPSCFQTMPRVEWIIPDALRKQKFMLHHASNLTTVVKYHLPGTAAPVSFWSNRLGSKQCNLD